MCITLLHLYTNCVYFCFCTKTKLLKKFMQKFNHITTEQVRLIAEKTNCTTVYVRQILRGDRKNKSIRAKRVFTTASKLNQAIEKAVKKADQILDQD